jgi:predicted transglutaminase-like cysteine proteinase
MTRKFCVLTLFILPALALSLLQAAAPAAGLAAAPAYARSNGGLFGQPEQPAPLSHPIRNLFDPMWQRVVEAEQESPSFTPRGEHFNRVDANAWRNLAQQAKNKPEVEVLHMVNGYFNQWPPKNDDAIWSTPEYWDTPREFMQHRGGDCEDYAIAKYYALRYLGFDAQRLRIVVVRTREADGRARVILHAVLAVYQPDGKGDGWFILDNNARPRDNIFPHTQYKGRFEPIYSMNEGGAWLHGASIQRN